MKKPVLSRFVFAAVLLIMCSAHVYGVVPVLIGPLQVLLAMLPAILMGILGLIVSILKPSAVKKGLRLLWKQKIIVAVLVVAIGGIVYGYKQVFPGKKAGTKKVTSSKTWPMFRGGLERRGSVSEGDSPAIGALVWSFTRDVKTFYSSAAVVGNRVYISSCDKGPFKDKGAIYCLDADSGGVVWKEAPDKFRATFSSPSVSEKYLVCGEGLHFTKDARIVCYDISDENNVKLLWQYRTKSHVESSPCIYKDKVYIGAGDDGYYCFKLKPDAEGKPVMVWHAEGDKYPDSETPPAICDGKVYVGLGMGGKGVCCFNAEDGKEIWRTDTPYPVFTPPTVAKGGIFVGMGNGNYMETAEQVKVKEIEKLKKKGASAEEIAEAEKILGKGGEVWCLDAETGDVKFKFKAGRTVLGAVAAGEYGLYFGSRDGNLYCISYEGKKIGTWNAHDAIIASPALTDDMVYFVTAGGMLYGLNAQTLQLEWEYTVGTAGMFISSPSVARGHVYIGSERDGLICAGQPRSEKKKPLWAGILGGPGNPGSIDGSPLPERGKFSWRYPASGADSAGSTERIGVTAPAACIEDAVYLPVSSGPQQGIVCLALEKKGEKKVPKEDKEKWIFKTDKGVSSSPATDGEVVIFTDGSRGEDGRFLYAADAEKGTELWKKPISKEASGLFVMTEDAVLAQDKPGMLSAYDHTGKPAWKAETGELAGIPAFTDTMVMTAGPSGLQVMDRLCGAVLWKTETGVSTGPVAGPDLLVYAGTDKGVGAYSLINGDRIWETDTGKPATVLVLGRNYISYINDKAQLVCLDINSRKEVGRVPGALPGIPPIINRGVVLFCRKGEIASADPSTRKVWRWMKTSWLGTVTAPIVQADSRIYFAADKRGFICARKKGR